VRKLRKQSALGSVADLPVRPKPIAKQLDHVIGRNPEEKTA
jgi:hypothetical protein